jgi:hypothetical protein
MRVSPSRRRESPVAVGDDAPIKGVVQIGDARVDVGRPESHARRRASPGVTGDGAPVEEDVSERESSHLTAVQYEFREDGGRLEGQMYSVDLAVPASVGRRVVQAHIRVVTAWSSDPAGPGPDVEERTHIRKQRRFRHHGVEDTTLRRAATVLRGPQGRCARIPNHIPDPAITPSCMRGACSKAVSTRSHTRCLFRVCWTDGLPLRSSSAGIPSWSQATARWRRLTACAPGVGCETRPRGPGPRLGHRSSRAAVYGVRTSYTVASASWRRF